MRVCHIETHIASDGTVILKDLPFPPGEVVDVTIQARRAQSHVAGRYPLRGAALKYSEPFESVDEEGWEALR